MGLDVTVYKNIKKSNIKDYNFQAYVIDKAWEYKIKNLEINSYYKGIVCNCGVSYAYSSHNRFREELLKIIKREDLLLLNGRIDWELLEKEDKLYFYDFINFADNEGCLDWDISKKLYNDFEKWKKQAMMHFYGKWFEKNIYIDWLNIFKFGKHKNSVVVFH